MATDRRTIIADAIIETLAEQGSRGLTHRAVDEAAGLPPGSTSYYLRTRASLLEAGVERLAELDADAMVPAEGESLPGALSRTLDHLLTTGRTRLLARYELTLESVRRPALHEVLATGTRHVRAALQARLAEDGVDASAHVAEDLLAMLEGLLFTQLTHGDESVRSRDDLQRAIQRVLPDAT